MTRFVCFLIVGLALTIGGCAEKEQVDTQIKETTPKGTTTHTITDKVEKTGDHKDPK